MLKQLFKSALSQTERDLLDTVRDDQIPNPATLRARLAALTAEIAETEQRWDALDARADPSSFLQLQPLAQHMEALRLKAAELPALIEQAEERRAAFLSLSRQHGAVSAEVAARLSAYLEHPPQDATERVRQLRALDGAGRIHVRLALKLQAFSSDRQFREPADPIKTLRVELELRIRELDRLRVPGAKPPLVYPPQMLELLDALDGTAQRKDTTV